MATFRLVDSGDFDATQAQFTFRTIGDRIYFELGELSADNRRLYESIIGGGFVGFFEVGVEQTDAEAPNARIIDDYTSLGVEIDEIPDIAVGRDYEIKFSQARPGEAVSQTITVANNEGVVRFSAGVNIDVDIPAQITFDYTVVLKRYTRFIPRFYSSAEDFDTDRPIPLGDPRYPRNVSIHPPTPYQSPGFFIHDLRFTPTFPGHLFVSMDLEESTVEEDLYFIVDADGNFLTDADGNFLVSPVEPMYQLVDADGRMLVDIDGNVLTGFY